jgi:hypothetical protein
VMGIPLTEAVGVFNPPNGGGIRWSVFVISCPLCGMPHLHWVHQLQVAELLSMTLVRRCKVYGGRYVLVAAEVPTLRRKGRRARVARLATAGVGIRP